MLLLGLFWLEEHPPGGRVKSYERLFYGVNPLGQQGMFRIEKPEGIATRG